MSHSARFKERLFTELRFSKRHLGPLRRLYRQMQGDYLAPDHSFRRRQGLHANMSWHYASSPRTLTSFRRCMDDTNLRESFAIVDGEAELLAACFVVVDGDSPEAEFHMDYGEREIPVGSTGTLITPLYELDPGFGHLDFREEGHESEYRYRCGDAILFDGKFEHRSQAALHEGDRKRALVSWSIASRDERYRHAIHRVIDSQSGAEPH